MAVQTTTMHDEISEIALKAIAKCDLQRQCVFVAVLSAPPKNTVAVTRK